MIKSRLMYSYYSVSNLKNLVIYDHCVCSLLMLSFITYQLDDVSSLGGWHRWMLYVRSTYSGEFPNSAKKNDSADDDDDGGGIIDDDDSLSIVLACW